MTEATYINHRGRLETELTYILQRKARQEWESNYIYDDRGGWDEGVRFNRDDSQDTVTETDARLRVKEKANEYLGELLPKIIQLAQEK